MTPRWKIWLEAARPKTLPAAVIPVVVATALAQAHGAAQLSKAAVCLVFALLTQIGTNFANDYFDFRKGADTAGRVGPRRAVAAGLVTPAEMLRAAGLVLTLAFLAGLLLVIEGGWLLLPVGLVSIVCAIAYTGGPYPLGYHGLGDLFVFLFFGLVAVGVTFFVQAGRPGVDVLLAAAAIGLLAANILVANNYRDAETDARAGKRTLVVRFGRRFALAQYGLSLVAALAVPALLWRLGYSWPVLAPLALGPWAFVLGRRLARRAVPAEQIALLADTAKFLAVYGVLLSAGLVFGK
ncbi:MAG: 1,4-dihydroxy-2-naphthoate octaprenyltransferase [Opitutus sp.]|nr:1,4-dihydroxy-2-naphthoate octaprenyltransferase [Opitutus sp.]